MGTLVTLDAPIAALPAVVQRALAAAGGDLPDGSRARTEALTPCSPDVLGAVALARLARAGQLPAPPAFCRRAIEFDRQAGRTLRAVAGRRGMPAAIAYQRGAWLARRAASLLAAAEAVWPA